MVHNFTALQTTPKASVQDSQCLTLSVVMTFSQPNSYYGKPLHSNAGHALPPTVQQNKQEQMGHHLKIHTPPTVEHCLCFRKAVNKHLFSSVFFLTEGLLTLRCLGEVASIQALLYETSYSTKLHHICNTTFQSLH